MRGASRRLCLLAARIIADGMGQASSAAAVAAAAAALLGCIEAVALGLDGSWILWIVDCKRWRFWGAWGFGS